MPRRNPLATASIRLDGRSGVERRPSASTDQPLPLRSDGLAWPGRVVRFWSMPTGISEDKRRLFLVVQQMATLGLPVHLVLAPLVALFGPPGLARFNVSGVAAWTNGYVVNNRGSSAPHGRHRARAT